MPRRLRLEFPGATYHVINRGNYRRALFASDGAAASFERCLHETCKRFLWRVHAFVIMRNHFHLALETPQPNLSAGMKHLQGTWVNRFNRYRGLVGRPFQGRYKALHVEPGHALAQVAHYIHLNPVRAKAVASARLPQFRWSSLWWFLSGERPPWLEPATLLTASGDLADTMAGWRCYLDYLDLLAERSPQARQQKFVRLSAGWALGTTQFRESLIARCEKTGQTMIAAQRAGDAPGDRASLRASIWEARLVLAARIAGIDLAQLGPAKSAPDKVLLATVLKLTTDVSNRWLGERLAMGTPASAGEFAGRFVRRGGSKRLREVLQRLQDDSPSEAGPRRSTRSVSSRCGPRIAS